MSKNNRVTKTNPKGAGRKPGGSVDYVGHKFGGWTVTRNVGYFGNDKKNYYGELQSPTNSSDKILLRTDTMKTFTGKNLGRITKKNFQNK